MPRMTRWFNTAGPCKPELHYMLSPLKRLPELQRLIDQPFYFVLHAPRQVGKTTLISTLAQELTKNGKYVAAVLSMEMGAPFGDNIGEAETTILSDWKAWAERFLPKQVQPPPWPLAPMGAKIRLALKAWSEAIDLPLVVFLDEIDSLQGNTLLSILRQLRSGYPSRPQDFPWALGLIGMRDVRDYKIASGGSDRLHAASPFNIKVKSLTLQNFTKEDVFELLAQHTHDTGQVFLPEALERIYYLTQGQPWLVNALAKELVEELVPDPTQAITLAHIDTAKEILIKRQDTHLDGLAERLREDRVRRVIEPILSGDIMPLVSDDDLRFVVDLGLCRKSPLGGFEIANPIYKEVIPRVLANGPQTTLPQFQPTWLDEKGKLDAQKLLTSFLSFWRQHGGALQESAPYREIAPHLVLMAYLHRVVNGGGTIDREYAIGSRRMDLCVTYKGTKLGIELKVWREKQKDPKQEGLEQLDSYLSGLGLDTGWLVIFDARAHEAPLSERVSAEQATSPSGRNVTLIRA